MTCLKFMERMVRELLDELEFGAKDVVERRQHDQRQHRGEKQADDVHGGQRMPERAAGQEQRNQSADGCQHGHQYRPQTRETGFDERLLQRQAFGARLRPVLVTVLAVVGGLIPLFLTGGALWHPLTAVHIVGLLLATVLTLVMLPTLYYVFCAKLKFIK